MIERYSRPEMVQIWSAENRWSWMLKVEIAVAEAQAHLNIIPKKAASEIRRKGSFSLDRIQEIEQKTQHDVIAFVSNVAENVGEWGRYVHFGMTSSDVLDTAFCLQVQQAGALLLKGVQDLSVQLEIRMLSDKSLACVGRTHGMWAEPTTLGLKWAGFLAELKRNEMRIKRALEQMNIAKLSGAVGTYSGQPPQVEKVVAKKLGMQVETVATQVIPRDRHAEMILALSLLGSGLERLAVELRHLQRSEVDEVVESFRKGQKGSSAMPHKKNPISAENITGLARLLRSYSLAAMENIALWHERDISHSSVERVIFPDAFLLADYALYRMKNLMEGLQVNIEGIENNLKRTKGIIYSSQALLSLVQKGLSREDAYVIVQRISQKVLSSGSKAFGEDFAGQFSSDPDVRRWLSEKDLKQIFLGNKNEKYIRMIIQRLL